MVTGKLNAPLSLASGSCGVSLKLALSSNGAWPQVLALCRNILSTFKQIAPDGCLWPADQRVLFLVFLYSFHSCLSFTLPKSKRNSLKKQRKLWVINPGLNINQQSLIGQTLNGITEHTIAAYQRLSSLVFFLISQFTMFSVQYWNPREAAWKGCGTGTFATLEAAREAQFKLIRQVDGTVRFRVSEIAAPAAWTQEAAYQRLSSFV